MLTIAEWYIITISDMYDNDNPTDSRASGKIEKSTILYSDIEFDLFIVFNNSKLNFLNVLITEKNNSKNVIVVISKQNYECVENIFRDKYSLIQKSEGIQNEVLLNDVISKMRKYNNSIDQLSESNIINMKGSKKMDLTNLKDSAEKLIGEINSGMVKGAYGVGYLILQPNYRVFAQDVEYVAQCFNYKTQQNFFKDNFIEYIKSLFACFKNFADRERLLNLVIALSNENKKYHLLLNKLIIEQQEIYICLVSSKIPLNEIYSKLLI